LAFIIVKKLSVAENQVVANDKRLRRQSKRPTPVLFSAVVKLFSFHGQNSAWKQKFRRDLKGVQNR